MEKNLAAQNRVSLGSDEYFLAVVHDLKESGQDLELAVQLATLLRQQAAQQTMGDSSSVPIELAQSLMQSVYYCIGLALKQAGGGAQMLTGKPLLQWHREGQSIADARAKRAKDALRQLSLMSVAAGSIAYEDTVFKALPAFFRYYDTRFFAHETPCDIDYQLCLPLPPLKGIEYIEAYISRLSIENAFCRCFKTQSIVRLLRSFCPGYRAQLINIFEPVLCNAVARALLGADLTTLDISEADRRLLWLRLESLTDRQLEQETDRALMAVCATLGLKDTRYLKACWAQVLPRLCEQLKQNNLEKLFVTLAKDRPDKVLRYADGMAMDDEKLRALIDEMRDCRHLSDKLAMVKTQVKSLSDFAEVADACFENAEFTALFGLLRDIDLAVLQKRIGCGSETQDCRAWEQSLMRYIASLGEEHAARIRKAAKRLREK